MVVEVAVLVVEEEELEEAWLCVLSLHLLEINLVPRIRRHTACFMHVSSKAFPWK